MTAPLPLDVLYRASAHPRPWALFSLPAGTADTVVEQLGHFVEHLNRTYAVEEKHLILGCWVQHPGLVWDLASLYAGWVEAMQSDVAAPQLVMNWHDRWLPGFYTRLPGRFGVGPDVCRIGKHRGDWNPAAGKIAQAAGKQDADVVQAAVAAVRATSAAVPVSGV